MALESGPRTNDALSRGAAVKGEHCRHCGGVLEALGFHFTCHLCGATYCFVHMRKHDGAHPRASTVVLAV